MKFEVQEVTVWDSDESVHVNYGLYADDEFPDSLDYPSLKKMSSVINQFIERKEAEK